jgi:iron complex outermembrane receptor protein
MRTAAGTASLWIVLVVLPGAQTPIGTVAIEVRSGERPLGGAEVVVNEITRRTDVRGQVSIPAAPGALAVTVAKAGYVPTTVTIQFPLVGDQPVVVDLQPLPTIKQDVVVVASTRTERGIDDQPLRVDVLPREEIEEKMLMTPGDIVMMMNEMGGMRVQAISPSLGAASVRIQGMRGRYTRFLSDGLPLFGEVGGLGLLQIPPMDLGQVEVIKGVASSMYGAGAMGGVVNLIARKPGSERVREFLINRSSRGGTDAVGFYSGPLSERWGLTLLGGGHWQERIDVNADAWSDLPKYARGVFRPRIYWDGGNGRTFFATTGVTIEDREGGTALETVLPVANVPYGERLDTRRFDVGMVGQMPIRQRFFVTARAAFARQRHTHTFGAVRERDRHEFAFGEVAVRGAAGRHAWVAGAAVEHDEFRPVDLPQFAYHFTIPGVFVQDDVEITRWLSVSASGRLDHHSEYGTFLSPRVAALFRSGRWNSRVSIGTGFFGPSALTEETEAPDSRGSRFRDHLVALAWSSTTQACSALKRIHSATAASHT